MQAMNAAPRGSAGRLGPVAMPRLRPAAATGESSQSGQLAAWAKLSPKLHPPPSGRGGQVPGIWSFIQFLKTGCLASEARQCRGAVVKGRTGLPAVHRLDLWAGPFSTAGEIATPGPIDCLSFGGILVIAGGRGRRGSLRRVPRARLRAGSPRAVTRGETTQDGLHWYGIHAKINQMANPPPPPLPGRDRVTLDLSQPVSLLVDHISAITGAPRTQVVLQGLVEALPLMVERADQFKKRSGELSQFKGGKK